MRRHHVCWVLPAALALATATDAAQGSPSPQSSSPNAAPFDATAKVAPLLYKSALATFKRLSETEPLLWREANEPDAPTGPTPVPKPAANAATMPMSKPMPGPHGEHKIR